MSSGYVNARFWISTAERAFKTFAYTLLGDLSANATGILNTDWPAALGLAGIATVLSVLGSIASMKIGPDDSPSLVGEPAQVPSDTTGPPLPSREAQRALISLGWTPPAKPL